jgi:hypothetical protein
LLALCLLACGRREPCGERPDDFRDRLWLATTDRVDDNASKDDGNDGKSGRAVSRVTVFIQGFRSPAVTRKGGGPGSLCSTAKTVALALDRGGHVQARASALCSRGLQDATSQAKRADGDHTDLVVVDYLSGRLEDRTIRASGGRIRAFALPTPAIPRERLQAVGVMAVRRRGRSCFP